MAERPKVETRASAALIAWANEWGPRFRRALLVDLERLGKAMAPMVEASRRAYRDAGSPYGDGDEGMLRWIGDRRGEAVARWERERREAIRETCETLRSRRGR